MTTAYMYMQETLALLQLAHHARDNFPYPSLLLALVDEPSESHTRHESCGALSGQKRHLGSEFNCMRLCRTACRTRPGTPTICSDRFIRLGSHPCPEGSEAFRTPGEAFLVPDEGCATYVGLRTHNSFNYLRLLRHSFVARDR